MTWQGASQEPGPDFWLHQRPWLCDFPAISWSLHVLFCKVGEGGMTPDPPCSLFIPPSIALSLSPGPASRAFSQTEAQTPAVLSSGEQMGFTL